MTDLEIEPFEVDITDEVKHLHDEHRRLAEHFRGKAFDHDTVAADYSQAGVRDLYEEHRDHASSLHESADLHEHTANVLALILGTRQ